MEAVHKFYIIGDTPSDIEYLYYDYDERCFYATMYEKEATEFDVFGDAYEYMVDEEQRLDIQQTLINARVIRSTKTLHTTFEELDDYVKKASKEKLESFVNSLSGVDRIALRDMMVGEATAMGKTQCAGSN